MFTYLNKFSSKYDTVTSLLVYHKVSGNQTIASILFKKKKKNDVWHRHKIHSQLSVC